MSTQTASNAIKHRLHKAAQVLETQNPLPYVGQAMDRWFFRPLEEESYGKNMLTPFAVPFEPSYSESEPKSLRFTVEPVPDSPPTTKRDEASREVRRLISPSFGRDALYWFDQRSEEWRGMAPSGNLQYGAWFGTSYDRDGLNSTKVYYELNPQNLQALPPDTAKLVRTLMASLPNLIPLFTTITCKRNSGKQGVTFLHREPLRLRDLSPLMKSLDMDHHLPSLMQLIGLTLGGRFELPQQSVLLGISNTSEGPELKLEIALGMLEGDVPPSFLRLLSLGLAERPNELRLFNRWLQAFTPEQHNFPGNFSVMSIRVTPKTPARVSVCLRPIEFELSQHNIQPKPVERLQRPRQGGVNGK